MGCACFGFNEWWFEILLRCYWLEVVGLFSSDLWHHLVCKWSIYTHLFIYFSFVFGVGSYSNVRILISVCFPFTVRVALRDWIWADFGCMHEKSWSQFWKIQLLSDGFFFFFLNIYLHQLLAAEMGSFLFGCFHCLCHRPWKIGY